MLAESTFHLLERVRAGENEALEVLFERYLQPLQRWASGRLPSWARSATDTHDLVQDTLLNTFKSIGTFEPRREGAFLVYLRQVLKNRIIDVQRSVNARPVTAPLDEFEHPHDGSPLEDAIRHEKFERYDRALTRLTEEEREAIVGRIELGFSFKELAVALEKPTADAARMAVTRALVRLAEEMHRDARG